MTSQVLQMLTHIASQLQQPAQQEQGVGLATDNPDSFLPDMSSNSPAGMANQVLQLIGDIAAQLQEPSQQEQDVGLGSNNPIDYLPTSDNRTARLDDNGNLCVLRTAHQLLLFNDRIQKPFDANQLTIYLELGYTASFISKLTGVHIKKVTRMMACHGMSCRNYADISDADLNNLVREILQLDRGLGFVRVHGCVTVRVPRQRIRAAYSKVIGTHGFPARKRICGRSYCIGERRQINAHASESGTSSGSTCDAQSDSTYGTPSPSRSSAHSAQSGLTTCSPSGPTSRSPPGPTSRSPPGPTSRSPPGPTSRTPSGPTSRTSTSRTQSHLTFRTSSASASSPLQSDDPYDDLEKCELCGERLDYFLMLDHIESCSSSPGILQSFELNMFVLESVTRSHFAINVIQRLFHSSATILGLLSVLPTYVFS